MMHLLSLLCLCTFLALIASAQAGSVTVVTTKPPTATFKDDSRHRPDKIKADITPSPSPKPNSNGAPCDIWKQDCPGNFKCIAEDLESTPRCRPLDNSPDQVGDNCSDLGQNDGDSCDVDGMCIHGVCRPLCTGSKFNPSCPSTNDICHIYDDGTPLCEKKCDPILWGSCTSADTYCTVDSNSPDQIFSCMYETGDLLGLAGKSCVETSQCQQGYACVLKTVLPNGFCQNNASLKCCTPLAEDVADCPAGMVLQPFYQAPPPGLEHVGVCVLF